MHVCCLCPEYFVGFHDRVKEEIASPLWKVHSFLMAACGHFQGLQLCNFFLRGSAMPPESPERYDLFGTTPTMINKALGSKFVIVGVVFTDAAKRIAYAQKKSGKTSQKG